MVDVLLCLAQAIEGDVQQVRCALGSRRFCSEVPDTRGDGGRLCLRTFSFVLPLCLLFSSPVLLVQMPWSSTVIYFADERVVPLTDDDSNYKLVAETLLAGRDGTGVKVVKLTEGLAPPAAAADYEEKLKGMDTADGVPVFGTSAGRGLVVVLTQGRRTLVEVAGGGCAPRARYMQGMVTN